jgi:hypothetical protein
MWEPVQPRCAGITAAQVGEASEGNVPDMSESQPNSNRTVTYLLGAIIVLLVVLVVILFLRQQPAATTVANQAAQQQAAADASSTSMPGLAPSTGAFDKATATKVPAGQAPEAFVKAYYQAILDKKFAVAFKMQPAASQEGQTVEGFQQTQEQMYGMKSFKIISSKIVGDTATVLVQQDLGTNGTWGATWTFVKDAKAWLVKERVVQVGAAQ